MDEDFKLIEIKVRVWMKPDVDPQEVVDEMSYSIVYDGVIDTEIADWQEV